MDNKMAPVHPGEILVKEFLNPMGVTQHRLMISIGVPPCRINETVHGRRRITADAALRLGRFFGMNPQFWVNLQSYYDLEIGKDTLGDGPDKIQLLRSVAWPLSDGWARATVGSNV